MLRISALFEGASEKELVVEEDSEALDVAAVLRLEALSVKIGITVTSVEIVVSKVVRFSEKNDVVVASTLCGSAERVAVSNDVVEFSILLCSRCSCSLASKWSHR